MPVVLRIEGFRLLFYANEGDPREPPHIHVQLGRDEAKFWISPAVALAYNCGLSGKMLNRASKIVEAHRDMLEREWHDYFA